MVKPLTLIVCCLVAVGALLLLLLLLLLSEVETLPERPLLYSSPPPVYRLPNSDMLPSKAVANTRGYVESTSAPGRAVCPPGGIVLNFGKLEGIGGNAVWVWRVPTRPGHCYWAHFVADQSYI